jgi:hypothetical protein
VLRLYQGKLAFEQAWPSLIVGRLNIVLNMDPELDMKPSEGMLDL